MSYYEIINHLLDCADDKCLYELVSSSYEAQYPTEFKKAICFLKKVLKYQHEKLLVKTK